MKKSPAFSLVSLLIALGLTTFLSAALIQAMIISKDQLKVVTNIIDLNDRARLAHDTLYDLISYAGFRNVTLDVPVKLSREVFTAGYVQALPQNTLTLFIQKTNANLGIDIVDCLSNPLFGSSAGNDIVAITLTRSGTNLLCQGNVLVSNVEQFLVFYGRSLVASALDEYNTGEFSNQTTSWVAYDASLANDPAFLRSIRAIRLVLLLASTDEIFPQPQDQQFYIANMPMDGIAQVNTTNKTIQNGGQDVSIKITQSKKRYKLVNIIVPLRQIHVRSKFDP